MIESRSPAEGEAGAQQDTEGMATQNGESHAEHKCVSVQTEYRKQDAQTITDDTEVALKQLISRREQLKDSYQEVLDRQTQAEKQLQVQIKQLKQKRDEELHKHKENLKSIQDLTSKKEETRKKVEKERKELAHKEQDLCTELAKLQSKSESIHKEHEELENKIEELLAEQAIERAEWDAELTTLKRKDSEVMQNALKELDQAKNAEVLALESRRDFLLISLEEAEKEAEVTLSYLRVAPSHTEWMQLKQRWESRLAGIQRMKTNIQEQFDEQIKKVKSGTKLSSLPSILAPDLPPPPSDPTLMLQRIALGPLQGGSLASCVQPRDSVPQQLMNSTSFPHQRPPPAALLPGNLASTGQAVSRLPSAAQPQALPSAPAPPNTDKLNKILEKLQARFPQCNKEQLTGILHQIKGKRGTLSGLTVDELCHLVATQLQEQFLKEPPNAALKLTQPIGHGRHQYQSTRISPFLPSAKVLHTGRPQPCLMCQKIVQPHELQSMPCSHIMHQDCIKVWALTNKNNSCPFCPNQR
ncbi:RING finger protein 214 [Hyperolius riggenbachi]|uniref:RING finger protein 214 n=1 Tax=Hyperolius riggenbachi TaxID=752182 RepID=UPI0035A2C265